MECMQTHYFMSLSTLVLWMNVNVAFDGDKSANKTEVRPLKMVPRQVGEGVIVYESGESQHFQVPLAVLSNVDMQVQHGSVDPHHLLHALRSEYLQQLHHRVVSELHHPAL